MMLASRWTRPPSSSTLTANGKLLRPRRVPDDLNLAFSSFAAWKGEADDNLDLRVSRDGSFVDDGPKLGQEPRRDWPRFQPSPTSFGPFSPWLFAAPRRQAIFLSRETLGFYLAAYRTPPSNAERLNEPLDSLGFVYVVEKSEMDEMGITFDRFREMQCQGVQRPA
jgi:hypothetical protein